MDISQIFIVLSNSAVIFLTTVVIVQPLENFLYFRSHGNRCSNCMSTIENVVQVFNMQINLKSWLVIAGDHHRSFGVHDGGACKTSFDCLKYQFRIYTGFLG